MIPQGKMPASLSNSLSQTILPFFKAKSGGSY